MKNKLRYIDADYTIKEEGFINGKETIDDTNLAIRAILGKDLEGVKQAVLLSLANNKKQPLHHFFSYDFLTESGRIIPMKFRAFKDDYGDQYQTIVISSRSIYRVKKSGPPVQKQGFALTTKRRTHFS